MPHNLNRNLAEKVEFVIGKRLRRGDHDALAGMDAERVEILHVADRYAVVGTVPDNLVFDFLPAAQRLLDEHLRGERERLAGNFLELLLVIAESGPETAQRVGGADDYRISDLARSRLGLIEVAGRVRAYCLDPDLVQPLDKELPVLGVYDGLDRRSEHLHPVFFQHSRLVQLDAAVERSLTSEREQYALRTLLFNDFGDEFRSDGEEINLVGNAFGSLHSRDVRIDQHRADSVLLEGLQRLGTAVVKLAGLSDFECAGAQDDYFLD